MRLCVNCNRRECKLDYKLCYQCSRELLRKMKDEGFLADSQDKRKRRDMDAKEYVNETKYGTDR